MFLHTIMSHDLHMCTCLYSCTPVFSLLHKSRLWLGLVVAKGQPRWKMSVGIMLRQRYLTGSAWCAICLLIRKGLTRAPMFSSKGLLSG
jgi:hypothetical protein